MTQLQEPQAHDLRPAQVQVPQALALPQLAEAGSAQAFAALQAQPLQVWDPCSAPDRCQSRLCCMLRLRCRLSHLRFNILLSSRQKLDTVRTVGLLCRLSHPRLEIPSEDQMHPSQYSMLSCKFSGALTDHSYLPINASGARNKVTEL